MPFLSKSKAEKTFQISSAPFLHAQRVGYSPFWDYVFALMPVLVTTCIFFGWQSLSVVFVSVSSAVIWEWLFRKVIKKETTYHDGSCIFTALVLGFLLPNDIQWPLIFIATFFTIIVAKELYGGFGQNLFHPALVGRAVLFVFFPVAMMEDDSLLGNSFNSFFEQLFVSPNLYYLGETSVLAIFIGGVFLIWKRRINWEIPFIYLVTVIFFSILFNDGSLERFVFAPFFFGAFFLITDSVTSPVTKPGRIFFSVFAGLLTVFLRGRLPDSEAVTFAVLLSNAVVPLIDWQMKPKRSFLGL